MCLLSMFNFLETLYSRILVVNFIIFLNNILKKLKFEDSTNSYCCQFAVLISLITHN